MNTVKRLMILLSFFLFCSTSFSVMGQVTIGTLDAPAAGALLDMKEWTNTDGGANASKGVLLPRVFLTTTTSLSDLITTNPDLSATKLTHTGLTVYNTNPALSNNAGVYCWDGAEWVATNPIPETRIFIQASAHNTATLLSGLVSGFAGWQILNYPTEDIDNENKLTTGIFIPAKNANFRINASATMVNTLQSVPTNSIRIAVLKLDLHLMLLSSVKKRYQYPIFQQ